MDEEAMNLLRSIDERLGALDRKIDGLALSLERVHQQNTATQRAVEQVRHVQAEMATQIGELQFGAAMHRAVGH